MEKKTSSAAWPRANAYPHSAGLSYPQRLLIFLGLAVGLHLGVLYLASFEPRAQAPTPLTLSNLTAPPKPNLQPIRIVPVDPQLLAKPATRLPDSPQIVDVPKTKDQQQPPKPTKYLAEHDNYAAKETRSRAQRPDYQESANLPPRASKQDNAANSPSAKAATPKPSPPKNLDLAQLIPPLGVLTRLAPTDTDEAKTSNKDPTQAGAETGGATTSRSAHAGPLNDFLDLETGEGTFLNTRAFKYAAFFNRLKKQVAAYWQPLLAYNLHDPTGSLYGTKPRLTVLGLTLKADGSLANIEIRQASGLDFLDEAAINAFKQAAPFSNPPKGLLDEHGLITFSFGFHVQMDSRF